MVRILTYAAFAAVCVTTPVYAEVLTVPSGGNLQAALDAAVPGDTIVLPAGSTFTGQFRFPAKAGVVTLTSSGPVPDRRITEADAPLLATIASGIGAMALDLYNSRNWTIDGIRLEPNVGGYGEVIGMHSAENIVLRRLLFVVPGDQQQKRFVLGNGRHVTLTQSHCAGVWRSGQDSQCFAAWDGAGPYTITDNYLEAASENVMFGGADSAAPDGVPADILVEGNLFTKRLEWKGLPRVVKNLFELKAARRVIIRNNIFERNWVDGQPGIAIVFTPRNQDGTAPWTVVEDVLFEKNIVRDTPSHFNILGFDNNQATGQTTRIVIRHNLLLGSGGGRLAIIGNEAGTVEIDHNTYVSPQTAEASMMTLYAEGGIAEPTGTTRTPAFAAQQLKFTNNLLQFNTYGLHSAVGLGTTALTAMTGEYTWTNNAFGGGWGTYPPTTTFMTVEEYAAQFDADYLLVPTSPFKGMATDGTDLGWSGFVAPPPPPPPPPPDPEPEPEPEPEPPPVTITTATLPTGVRARAYSAQLTAEASTALTWSITSGALPAGLKLDASTGVIAGTPTKLGMFSFTVAATDGRTTATKALTIRVAVR